MFDFEDDFEIPVDQPTVPVMPSNLATEQAFYTSEIMGNPDEFDNVRHDLENVGSSPFHQMAQEEWRTQQDSLDNNIMLDLIGDSTIPLDQRKGLVRMHDAGNFKSTNIRDKYIQDNASTDFRPIDVPNAAVRNQDIEAQELFASTVEDRKKAFAEVQKLQNDYIGSKDISITNAIGGMLLDLLPFALPNFRSTAAAAEAGLELDVTDEAIGGAADLGVYDAAIKNLGTSFLATGSVNTKISDAFRSAPPEQQKQILQDVIKGIESIPGTDFNKVVAFQEILGAPLSGNVEIGARNFLGVLEASPLGQLATAPVRTVKWYTTLAPSPTLQKVFGTSSRATPEEEAAARAAAGEGVIDVEDFVVTPTAKPTQSQPKGLNAPQARIGSNSKPTTDPKKFKEKFPHSSDEVVTDFDQDPTGMGRGNLTDNVPGAEKATETLSAERVAEDFVAGQNFGEQQAARELLDIAKGIPTAENNRVFIDDLWKASGGADVVTLDNFKEIIKGLHDKGSIKLVNSGKKLEGVKKDATTIIGRDDEALDMLDFSPQQKRTIADEIVTSVDEFGDDLRANALIDRIISRASETPAEILKKRTSKVYSTSFADKQAGNAMVRVDSAKFDAAFSKAGDYVGAGGVGGSPKKYKGFQEFFDETSNIEVGSVKITKNGQVQFVDGKHRFAVLRDKGIKKIPLSMDVRSIINAQKAGLIDEVVKEVPKTRARGEVTTISRMSKPNVTPNSPAGTLSMSNPVAAANKGLEILEDISEKTAQRMGTSRADVVGSWVLPSIEKSITEQFPSIGNMLNRLDDEFKKEFELSNLDANIAPVTAAREEVDLITDTMREIRSTTYQQSNSTIEFGRNSARGIAQFGRNDHYGYSSEADVNRAFEQVQAAHPNFNTRIIKKGNEFFVEQEWEHNYNFVDNFMFGLHSLDSSFLGIDVSGIAKTGFGDIIIPKTMSDNSPNLTRTGGQFLNEISANRVENKFLTAIQETILSRGMPRRELNAELRAVQEDQVWLPLNILAAKNAHLPKAKFEQLLKGYTAYRRLADYNFEWANRLDHENAKAAGHIGIYDENGLHVANGTKKYPQSALDNVLEVWSYEKDMPIPKPKDLQGGEILLARDSIEVGDDLFQYVFVSGKYETGILPSRTLPKIEGWVPRNNLANFYVDVQKVSAKVNGIEIKDPNILKNHRKVVAAGMSRAEAQVMIDKLSKEGKYANSTFTIREARETTGNATISDYKTIANTTRSSRGRGQRIMTPNGPTKLDEPVETLARSTGAVTRVQAWAPYLERYKKLFVEKFGEYSNHEFPSDISQIVAKETMSELELKELKVAQRLFKHLSDVQAIQTMGDSVWSGIFHRMADTLENVNIDVAQLSRDVAGQGNLLVRIPKSIATNLMIHANPARQWLVQPQQLMEFNAILPEYFKQSALDIPAMITAMQSRAPILRSRGDKALYDASRKLSGMAPEEFDEVFEAFWNTGLPQAVDMNSMLLGGLKSGGLQVDPSKTQEVINLVGGAVKAPGLIGKKIGFTPAELANITGTWLFTRQRWMKDNPGLNWNTPENVATITKQAWDISHSMIGNAGSAPWQRGAIGAVLQFGAVTHKGFMQKLMSKTLTPEERIKMTAARLAIYGVHGIPMGAVGIGAIVNQFGSEEMQKQYPKYAGGFVDMVPNAMIDIYNADPLSKSDIIFSKGLSPIPETHLFYETAIELKRLMFQEGGAPNPRFASVQALGSLMEAFSDIQSRFEVQELDTKDKLEVFINEAAEVFSGYNNYTKAHMMRMYRDKKAKSGKWLGLEVSEATATAQLFGFITRQEENGYLIANIQKEREDSIQQATREIVDSMNKLEDKIGTPDWIENNRRTQILITGMSEDPDWIAEVNRRVDNTMLNQIRNENYRDNIYVKIMKDKAGKNDEHRQEYMRLLKQSAESNENDRQLLELIEEAETFTIER